MKKFCIGKERKYDIICYIVMALFALAMLLLFSRETSPLFGSAYNKMDSIQYKLAGKMMLDGYVPFKDFFQQKGVSFFYIQAIGEFFCKLFNDNRFGTFFIQYINFIAIFGFMFSIAKILLKKVCEKPGLIRGISLLAMCPAMYVYVSTFVCGNYTEEYSVLFNVISVWLGVKYIDKIDESNPESYIHKPVYALAHAVLFSFAFWVRPNNCISVCTNVAFIVVILLIKKQYKNLLHNAGLFIAGFVGSTALFLSYYIFNGAISDVIYGQFGINFKYVSANSKTVFVFLLPLVLCILYGLYMLLIKKSDFILALLCEISSVFMLLMYLVLGSQYPHYNMFIMVPVFLFTLLVLRNVTYNSFKNIFCLNIIIPLVLFCGASYIYTVRIYDESYYSIKSIIAIHDGKQVKESDAERIGKELQKIIPEESRDDIYVYPGNIDCYQIYYYADVYPFYKNLNPVWYESIGAEKDVELFYEHLYNDPPEYVVVNESVTEETDYIDRTEVFIETECELWYEGEGFKVFVKKG